MFCVLDLSWFPLLRFYNSLEKTVVLNLSVFIKQLCIDLFYCRFNVITIIKFCLVVPVSARWRQTSPQFDAIRHSQCFWVFFVLKKISCHLIDFLKRDYISPAHSNDATSKIFHKNFQCILQILDLLCKVYDVLYSSPMFMTDVQIIELKTAVVGFGTHY